MEFVSEPCFGSNRAMKLTPRSKELTSLPYRTESFRPPSVFSP